MRRHTLGQKGHCHAQDSPAVGQFSKNGERFSVPCIVFDAETEKMRDWRSLREWLDAATTSRAKSNRELAARALLAISQKHDTGQALSDEEQAHVRKTALATIDKERDVSIAIHAANILVIG